MVYPPTGSTAYEREMSTPPMLPPTLILEYGPRSFTFTYQGRQVTATTTTTNLFYQSFFRTTWVSRCPVVGSPPSTSPPPATISREKSALGATFTISNPPRRFFQRYETAARRKNYSPPAPLYEKYAYIVKTSPLHEKISPAS